MITQPSPRTTLRRPGPLSSPAFRKLLAARTTSVVGNAVAPIALAFAVLDLTGSAADLGVVVATRSIANVAMLLLGGVIADRLPRSLVLAGTCLVAAVTQGGVAALVLTGCATVPLLILLSAVNGAAAAVNLPAASALVPETVPADALRPANALLRLGLNSGTVLGASAGAGLVALTGPGWGLALDSLGFAAAALLYRRIRPTTRTGREDAARSAVIQDLRDGWRIFASHSWLWTAVLMFAILNAAFVGATTVMGPLIANATFGRAEWGVVVAAQTVGMALGAVLALRWHPRRPLGIGICAMVVTAAPVVALAVAPAFAVLVVAFAAAGMAIELFTVAWDQSLQSRIPREALSRVYSYDMVGSFLAVPIGQAAVGPIAAATGTTPVLLGCAALIVLATTLAASNRRIWATS